MSIKLVAWCVFSVSMVLLFAVRLGRAWSDVNENEQQEGL